MPDREQPRYGWRPDIDIPRQHVVLPGATLGRERHHTTGRAWCGGTAYLCAGPRPDLDWAYWRRCMACLPGWDRYAILAALADADDGLTDIALLGAGPFLEDLGVILGRLITAQQIRFTWDTTGPRYRLTDTERALWERP